MNTKNTTLTIKLPKDLRDGAKTTAKKIGIPLTTVITALLRQFALDEEITLSAKRPNTETKRAIAELRAGNGERFTGSTENFFKMLDRS